MRRRIRNKKTLLAIVAAAATALALSGGAVAYYSSAGHGSGSASVASPDPLSIAAQTPAANLLYPGGSGEVDATVSNPNPFPVRINSLVLGSGGIGVDSAHSGCDTSALHFTSQNNGGAGWDVPARSGRPTEPSTSNSAARSAWTPPQRTGARARPSRSHWRRAREDATHRPESVAGGALVGLVGLATGGAYAALSGSKTAGPATPKITAAPPKLTNQAHAAFGYSSTTPVDFLCSLDAGAFAACGSGTTGSISYAGPLAEGAHILRVEAQFGAAIGKPAETTWTVDTQAPPPPVFTKIPPDSTSETKATFRWGDAERKAKFQCELDAAAYSRCGRSKRYRGLTTGVHALCVRSLDKAGNASGASCATWVVTPAAVTFSISGNPTYGALLYPGAAAVPLNLVFTNSHPAPITVQSVTVSVTGTSAGGCGAANFSVSQQLRATPTVPAGATASLQQLGVDQSDWPQLRMLDAGNQDVCRNASVNLTYAGTATG